MTSSTKSLILVWGERVITGGDLLGRLLRGVATVEKAHIRDGGADRAGRQH